MQGCFILPDWKSYFTISLIVSIHVYTECQGVIQGSTSVPTACSTAVTMVHCSSLRWPSTA